MAKRTVHKLIDDMDGKDADETVRFALDGVEYEIDLSAKHAAELRKALKPYVTAGSKLSRGAAHRVSGRSDGRRGRSGSAGNADQNRAIREWAQAKGMPVSDRGRIKQDIVDQFHAENGR